MPKDKGGYKSSHKSKSAKGGVAPGRKTQLPQKM